MSDLLQLANDYFITLNGIKADVLPDNDGVLIHNGEFRHKTETPDTIQMSRPQFLKQLQENDGRFTSG